MKIRDIVEVLENIAPPHLQESYDNAGLIVGNPDDPCTGVLFCLDSTEEILVEAQQKKCNLVVAHHPIVFRGLKKLNGVHYVERVVIHAIRHNIAIFAIHTNLDNVHQHGVNQKIAERLGLINTRILQPKPEWGNPNIGAGVLGELPSPLTESELLQRIKINMKTMLIRHTRLLGKLVRKVAVCGGSGSFLLHAAQLAGADFFITADMKYHEFFEADGKLVVADIGHYESEQFTIELLHELVSRKFPTFALHSTEQLTNPVRYF